MSTVENKLTSVELPKQGLSRETVLAALQNVRAGDSDWKSARMFGLVYRTDDEVHALGKEVFGQFITENGLSPFAFPSLLKFETEVVSMTARLLNGGTTAVGTMTSGGTESILMSVKSCRNHARATKPEITAPEMIIPTTAHPGWDKAAHYLDIKLVRVPVGADFRADVAATRRAVNANTILLVASAPTYPHGVIDPIEGLSDIALEKNIWLHVDACLGGFVLPFARKLGYDIPGWDFAVPGVRSISADVHKYGYAPKGISTVLYRSPEYRIHQFSVYVDFPGGVYATPALAGGRTGGAPAAAWAVMNFLGEEGYLRLVKDTMEATRALMAGANAIPGLKVLGNPQASIFAIGSDTLNLFALGDAMKKRRWHMESQHLPPSLHVTVSPGHIAIVDEMLRDLREAADEVRALAETDISEQAAMYGMMGSLPDRAMAKEMALHYLDSLYRVEGQG